MKKRITKISIHQTSKVLGVIYIFIGAIMAVIMFIVLLAVGSKLSFALLMGFIYLVLLPVFAYLMIALFTWCYNKVAARFGGIEFVLEDYQEE
ncbi:hypothetical protein ACFL4K_00990 [Candidatus Neomarinimicrobiota bacterium]